MQINRAVPKPWEAPLAIVLSVLIFYSGVVAPLSPLPLLLYGMYVGRRAFYACFAVSAALAVLLAVMSVFELQPFQLLAWALFTALFYEVYRRDVQASKVVALLALLMIALTSVEVVALAIVQRMSLDAVILKSLELEKVRAQVAPSGFIGDIDFQVIAQAIQYLFFGMIFGFWLLLSAATALLLRPIVRVRALAGLNGVVGSHRKFTAGNLMEWKAPEAFSYLLVIALFLFVLEFAPRTFPTFPHLGFVPRIGANVAIALCSVYFLQGIAVVAYYLNKVKMRFLAVFFLVFIILQFHFVVLIAGILDNWWNLRRLERGGRIAS